MRILYINTVLNAGSTGKICTDLYESLTRLGHQCCIAYGRGNTSNSLNGCKIGSRFNNYVHCFETRCFDNHGFSSRLSTTNFLKFIRKFKPDIIHLHNLHGYYLNIKILFDFLKDYPAKIIWTFHDCWNFSGHAAFIEKPFTLIHPSKAILKDYPKTLFFDCSKKNYIKKKKVFTSIEMNKLLIVTPSWWLKKFSEKTFFSKYNTRVIYNGINQELFKYDLKIRKTDGKKIILGVANIWDSRKGLCYFNMLCNDIDLLRHDIIIVGKISKSEFFDSRIIHIEQTSNIEELVALYNKADIFVNPTLQDNFPTTNIESLSCGTPVITFDTGGSGEAVCEYPIGESVEKGNYQKLKEKINEYLSVKEKQENITKIVEYSSKFSKDRMITEYLDIYNKL